MKIEIENRLMPFSHTPGAKCLIPCTNWEIEAYPTLIRMGKGKIELKLALSGPVAEFLLLQDLEKNCIWVSGIAKEGHFRFKIHPSDSGIDFLAERVPRGGIGYSGTHRGILKPKERIHFPAEIPYVVKKSYEKLSLGSHKSQDWDLVWSRSELSEILPVLFALGQRIPYVSPQPISGTAKLLQMPADRNSVAQALQIFLKAAFTKMMIPRWLDDQHQGLVTDQTGEGDPLYLIQEGAKVIRALFFQQNERRMKLLPLLPPSFDSGRLIRIHADGIGEIDLEWSKKLLRRIRLRADTSGDVVAEWPKEIERFRIRNTLHEKGKIQASDEPLRLEIGKNYFLDRFQK